MESFLSFFSIIFFLQLNDAEMYTMNSICYRLKYIILTNAISTFQPKWNFNFRKKKSHTHTQFRYFLPSNNNKINLFSIRKWKIVTLDFSLETFHLKCQEKNNGIFFFSINLPASKNSKLIFSVFFCVGIEKNIFFYIKLYQ